jgi:hypothetical protein
VIELERTERKHGEAVGTDQEGIFAGAVQGAAILDHPQAAYRILIFDAVIEEDHAVGDVLFDSVPGKRSFTRFGGNDGGDAFLLQPAEQAAQLGTQNVVVAKTGEQRFDRIQHHTFGPHGLDRALQADKQPFEIVLAGCLDLAALHANIIHEELLTRAQAGKIKSHGPDVFA